jgi:hypothetical protein
MLHCTTLWLAQFDTHFSMNLQKQQRFVGKGKVVPVHCAMKIYGEVEIELHHS